MALLAGKGQRRMQIIMVCLLIALPALPLPLNEVHAKKPVQADSLAFRPVSGVPVADVWPQFQPDLLTVMAVLLVLALLVIALALGWIRLKRLDGIIKRSAVVAMSWRNEPGWPVSYVSANITLFGYKPQQLQSGELSYGRLIHPDDLERIGRDLASHLANGPDDYRQVYRLRHGDGHWIWIDGRTWLTRNSQGKVTRINGVLRDATAEHQAEQRLEHSRHLLQYIIEHMHGAVAVHDLDMNYVYVSQKYLDMFSVKEADIIGKNHYEVFPELPQKLRDVHQRVLQGEVLAADDDPFYHPDGSMDWTRWECRPWFSADGTIGGLIVYTEITTERKETELKLKQHAEALARNNARLELLATVFKAAREGIIITDATGRIEEVNAAFERMTGYQRDEVVGKNPRMLRSGRHGKGFFRLIWKQLIKHGYWSGEIWNRRKNGEIYPQSTSITALQGSGNQVDRYVALFSDVSEQKLHEQQLQYIAQYDALTGLPNRQLMTERLHHAMARCDELGQSMAVVYLDLDAFKDINEALGQQAGDRLLCELSQRLKANLHHDDSVARIGGDELAVLLANLDSETAAIPRLDELLEMTQSVFAHEGREIQLSASLGVTFYPQPEPIEADQLLRQADQAMYQAKLAGKSRYCLFNMAEDLATRGMHETLHRIRRGLENDEFILFFQPKVNMRSGEVLGAEALIRWQHPERGLLSPAQFLPLVEQDDLALEMGQWVIEQALSQLEAWQAAGYRLAVSVNIFGRQLQHEDFVADLQDTLVRYPLLEPGQLEIEVLETSALEDMDRVSVVIEDCAEMGVRCALDDFGTGYSSLTYLKRLPASILKVDQSFVRDMLEDPDDLAIVTGILGLARSFQRESVAEGVETLAHGEILLDLDCELAQGYGIARPMPAEDFLPWMKGWQPGPTWRGRRPRQLEERDLITCMVEHRSWIAALARHVESGAPHPELNVSECRFGRWLNEQFAGPHASSEALQEIDQLHQYLHEKAESVIRDRAARKSKDAERGMEAVYRLRDELLQRLQVLDLDGYSDDCSRNRNDASDTTDQNQRRDQD